MKVLRYEDSLASITEDKGLTIFLAGPTVRGNQPHLTSWRPAAIEEFAKQGYDGTLILPEFTRKAESDKGKFWIPPWEFAGLTGCDAILFWIPRTKELIGLTTNHEHGYWLGKRPMKCVYGRPNDSYRNSYLDIMWSLIDPTQDGYQNLSICSTLAETVAQSIVVAKVGSNREKSKVPVESPYGAF